MLKDTIMRISKEYIAEAKNSPTLFEDMAAMEKYMAESYSERIFIELLQNADDCGSKNILVETYKNHIIFANDGRPFDDNDVIAISRSGASKKERGVQIGYRGIGFKSTTFLTDEILIYSNNTIFTFSKDACMKHLSITKDKFPTVRIPFLVEDLELDLLSYIANKSSEYTTIFVFKNAKISQFEDELKSLTKGDFMFLNNVLSCKVNLDSYKDIYKLKREYLKNAELITLENKSISKWLIRKKGNISVSFLFENGKVVPCDSSDAVYHCFLPTLDKSPFLFKINADFPTDPSRKHIMIDSITDKSIKSVSEFIYEIIQDSIQNMDETYTNLFEMILNAASFSRINSMVSKELDRLIINNLMIENNDGDLEYIKNIKSLPDYFDKSEKLFILTKSNPISCQSVKNDYYHIFSTMLSFIEKYSLNKYTDEEIAKFLADKMLVESIPSQMYAKILSYVASVSNLARLTNKSFTIPESMLIPTSDGIYTRTEFVEKKKLFKDDIKKAIYENTNNSDLTYLCQQLGIDYRNSKESIDKKKSVAIKKDTEYIAKPVVSKWKTAERQCLELERYFGNKSIDVSKQNLGYDIESTTANGEKRFIEVKSLSNENGYFSLTNNEYTAAHRLKESYYICLVVQKHNYLNFIYINNPLEKLVFEKRIRQYEWYCEDYSGEMYTVEFR